MKPVQPQPTPIFPFPTQRERDLHALAMTSLSKSAEPLLACLAELKLIGAALSSCETELETSKLATTTYYLEFTTALRRLENAQTKFLAAHQELATSVGSCSGKLATLTGEWEQSRLREANLREECSRWRSEAEAARREW